MLHTHADTDMEHECMAIMWLHEAQKRCNNANYAYHSLECCTNKIECPYSYEITILLTLFKSYLKHSSFHLRTDIRQSPLKSPNFVSLYTVITTTFPSYCFAFHIATVEGALMWIDQLSIICQNKVDIKGYQRSKTS